MALMGTLIAAPASAQAPNPAASPSPQPPVRREVINVEGELPEVPPASITVLRLNMPVLLTPASVSVVPRTVFDSQDAFDLGDALRNVSGVSVGSGFGVFDFFTIRGFDSLSSGLVLTDGAFEPESTVYPLYNVQQVEVLKGPAAFLYGANPLSGAVNLVRKQPASGRVGTASLSYGRFGTAEGGADVNLGRADGTLALRVSTVLRDSAGYRDDKDSTVFAINPVLAWQPGGGTSTIALGLEYVRSRYAPDVGLPIIGGEIADVPRTRSYQSPLDASEQDVARVRLDYESRLGKGRLRVKAYATDFSWDSQGTLFGGVFPNQADSLDLIRILPVLVDSQRVLGVQGETIWTARTGRASHELLAGVELARLTDEFTLDLGLLPTIDVYAPVETAVGPPFLLPGFGQAGDTRSTVIAPYVIDRMILGSKVEAVVGARFDVIDYRDAATATERDDRQLSPMLGLVVKPREGVALYAQGSSSFAPPSTLVVGEREPEKSRQIEAGVKAQLLGGKVFATAAAYHLERQDIAIPDATGITRQQGSQRSRGLELEVSADVTQKWFATASYAFTDAELTEFAEIVQVALFPPVFAVVERGGNVPAFAPRHLVNVWALRRMGAFTAGAGGRYVSRQYIAEDNAYAIDGHLVLDAMAALRTRRLTFRVNLKNLTDREYETRGFAGTSVLPAEPFTATAAVTLALDRR